MLHRDFRSGTYEKRSGTGTSLPLEREAFVPLPQVPLVSCGLLWEMRIPVRGAPSRITLPRAREVGFR